MPIQKIPVVHNLGIISHTQRTDLQKRLLKKAELIESSRKVKPGTRRNPFEITEEFIRKYNGALGTEDQDKCVDLAEQLLSRSKRRAGLKSLGEGDYTDLPLAWTELLLLSLCCGNIQNDSLDSLLVSLDQAPVHVEHVPILFYLGESVLYWIGTNISPKPNLYTCEVKMLKVGYLVFLRLFLYHKLGNLSGYHKSKSHLRDFLKALAQCEPSYLAYPNLLFMVNFILWTGEVICGLGPIDNGPGLSHSDSQNSEINQVLRHSLLSWYCVQNNIRQLSQVTHQLILMKEAFCDENWLDGGLGLMVLGEAAKSSTLCLRVLLNLPADQRDQEKVRNGTQPEKQVTAQQGGWPWQLDHIYTNVLADICLRGCSAEIRKVALVGRRSCTGPSTASTEGLLSLLKRGDGGEWQVRYTAVRALMKVCYGLSEDVSQEGLRNAAWMALQEHLDAEGDPRVKEAIRVIEAEVNGPKNMFCSAAVKTASRPPAVSVSHDFIARRLALAFSQLYLQPVCVQRLTHTKLRRDSHSPIRLKHPSKPPTDVPPLKSKQPHAKPATSKGSLSDKNWMVSATHGTCTDFNTRTELNLRKIIEDQWQKELQVKMAEEEELEKEELEKQRKQEDEHLREVMRSRLEKVKKVTKPYELSRCEN